MQDLVERSGNFIKGKIGENIVLQLLRALDFQVYHNGYEITHPAFLALMQKERSYKDKISKLRARPDFMVTREAENGRPSLYFEAEVKFRFAAKIKPRELEQYDDDVRCILLDEKNFWSALKQDILSLAGDDLNKPVHFSNLMPLENDPYFDFSPEQKILIEKYKSIIGKYMPAPDHNKKTERLAKNIPVKNVSRSFPVNHGGDWDPEDDEKLLEEFEHLVIRYSMDETIGLLAAEFDRTENSIRAHLAKLMPGNKYFEKR